ncbi:MAG: carboxypeptidase M32 [Planctomycetaceae bacterium]
MSKVDALYDELIADLKKAAILSSISSLAGWDEQTYMPKGGVSHRSEQSSLLAGMLHERATSARRGELIAALEGSDLGDEFSVRRINIREARRQYNKAVKLPQRLVEELSRVCSFAQQAWVEARKKKDYKTFEPWLEKVVALKKEEAAAIGYKEAPYDALLDDYEPGATASSIQKIFTPLREELVKLVQQIGASRKRPDVSILTRKYPVDAQKRFATEAASKIGFNFDEGRLDETAHPFCSGIGPGDTRLTTRYDEHHFPGAFFGVLHEAGHGIYDQGTDRDAYGTPKGCAVSLGVHESQSRMWENFVGRSRAFWTYFFGDARKAFPEALASTSLDDFHFAINDVRPSMIRVESDEVTYNLHIMLRFEIEQALTSGALNVKDVPSAWNEAFTRSFGITPKDDSEGCLQDIHWSFGGIGYFPTYSLGNMYAAQLFEAAARDLGDLHAQFAKGEFDPLRKWLNRQVHEPGQTYPPAKLIERITGSPPSHEPLVAHLRAKFTPLYGL